MSHTMIMLIAALALLVLLRLSIRDAARATRLFLVLWLVVSVANLLFGVLSAGYGWGEEAMVWLLVFGVPAAFALITQRFRASLDIAARTTDARGIGRAEFGLRLERRKLPDQEDQQQDAEPRRPWQAAAPAARSAPAAVQAARHFRALAGRRRRRSRFARCRFGWVGVTHGRP